MITYLDVIFYLRPGAKVAIVGGEGYENIDWGQEIPIDQATLDANRQAAQDAKDAADAAKAAQAQTNAQLKADQKADSFVQTFIDMTPAQLDNFIDTNIVADASVKTMFKRMAKMLLLLARKEYKD